MPQPPAPASGLPEPVAPLSSNQFAVRRAVDRDFAGDPDAAAQAVGLDSDRLVAHLTGRESVPDDLLERLADALGYSLDQMLAPHPHSVWNPDRGWVTPGDPSYDEVLALVRSAQPAASVDEDEEL